MYKDSRLLGSITRLLDNRHQLVSGLSRGLIGPKQMLQTMTQRLDDWSERLVGALPALIDMKKQQLVISSNRLQPPELEQKIEKLSYLSEKLSTLLPSLIQNKRQQLALSISKLRPSLITQRLEKMETSLLNLSKLMESYHYKKVLKRGFALVRDDKGGVVTSVANIKTNSLDIEFHDGHQAVEISDEGKPIKQKKSVKKSLKKKARNIPEQKNLFD